MESEQETLVGVKDVADAIATGKVEPLSDLHSIEAIIFAIHELEDEISSLQKLKKKRIAAINTIVTKVEDRMEFLKSIIFETLTHFKEKKVRFPGVGMVSKRKPRVSFEILHQKDLMDCLVREKECDGIISKRTVIEINKHALNTLLLMWSKIDKLPTCVKEKKTEISVTVKFDEDPKEIEDEQEETISDLTF